MIFNYFICLFIALAGFYMLIFQNDMFKNIVAISLIWFSIIIFVVSLNIGFNFKYLFIFNETKSLFDPFLENALVIFDIIRIFTLTVCLVIISKINNNKKLQINNFKGGVK